MKTIKESNMKIGQYLTDQDIIKWYSEKHELEYHVVENSILNWIGVFIGQESTFLFKNDTENWAIELFQDFPELNDGVLVIYDN